MTVSTSTTEDIRNKMKRQFPQLAEIAAKAVAKLLVLEITVTVNDWLDDFINDSMDELGKNIWGFRYDRAVIYFAGHFITLSQPEAVNSGIKIRDKAGEGGGETEYMRPSMNSFGKYGTTKYGQMFEAEREELKKSKFSRGLV